MKITRLNKLVFFIFVLLSISVLLFCFNNQTELTAFATSYNTCSEINIVSSRYAYNKDGYYYQYSVFIDSGQKLNVVNESTHEFAVGSTEIRTHWYRAGHNTGSLLDVNHDGRRYDFCGYIIFNLYIQNSSGSWNYVRSQETHVWEYNNSQKEYEGSFNHTWTLTKGTYKLTVRSEANRGNTRRQNYEEIDIAILYVLDSEDPQISLNGVNEQGYANSDVKVNYSDKSGILSTSYKLNGSAGAAFSNGQIFSQEGEYEVSVTDGTYNSTKKTFIIDKTRPTISCVVGNGAFTNKTFTVTATDDKNLKKLYYKSPLDSEFRLCEGSSYTVRKSDGDGAYSFYAEDSAGNRTQSDYVIYLDTVAPDLILSGVIEDSGFVGTKGNFKVEWSEKIGGAGAQLMNNTDALSVKYSFSTSKFPTSANIEYVREKILSTEGFYFFQISDKAGNIHNYQIVIDRTAPVLTLNGVEKNGFTNTNVKVIWSTAVGSVGAQRMTPNDTLSAAYSISSDSSFPKSTSVDYIPNEILSAEGNYLMTLSDKVGNISTYKFTIDKSAPIMTISGLVGGLSYYGSKDGIRAVWPLDVCGVGTQLTNSSDLITVSYAFDRLSIPTSANSKYARNTLLDAEGYYLITISDRAGNTNKYQIVVDKTAPTVSTMTEYTNTGFEFTARDTHNAAIYYSLNDEHEHISLSGSLSISCEEKNYGIWKLWATDELGNKSEVQTVKLFYREDFGNLDNIKNGFKQATWFTVTLPSRIYTKIAGAYTFTTQENALDFAISKEWEYRVEKLASGWSYVNLNNESVSQIYTSRSDLDAAILKYATAYVSERNEMQLGSNFYPNPTDGNGVSREDALTFQSLKYPDMLQEYSNLPLYLIRHDFSWSMPIAGVTGNAASAQIRYIASDFAVTSSGENIDITFGTTIINLLSTEGANKQGYFLVIERDLCGNEQRYVVYLDNEIPSFRAKATYGNGSRDYITFNNDFVIKNANVMLYLGLEIEDFFDNMDECIMISLSGRGMDDEVYVKGDSIPVLTRENGYYGRYTVNVYDRSLNYLSFEIRIAGEEAYLTNTSLTNETRCVLTINYDSSNNGITKIQLFKVAYTGEYNELFVDSDGIPVSAATLSYTIRVGGKYIVRFTDIFGRTVESDPLFYMKGLPSGSLKGVKEGGITNQDVSFEYSDSDNVFLYAFIDKQWVRYDEVVSIEEKEGYRVASIVAGVDTSLIYKFFLYVAEDMNLFVEYRFEIDCIVPDVEILTDNGEEIQQNAVTTKPFVIRWNEANVSARYFSKSNPLGEYSEETYNKNMIVTKAGTYVFRVKDAVGNLTEFTVTLDDAVSYRIDGKYSMLEDGSYISKTDIVLTVTERTNKFECSSNNGITIMNGGTMSEDGTYVYTIQDIYGNETIITVIIDKLPPIPVILSVSGKQIPQNGATNEEFIVSCVEENVEITLRRGTQSRIYNGEVLSAEGIYSFIMSDRMKNSITFTVTIDLTVNYKVQGTYKELDDGSYISKYYLSISVQEEYQSFVVDTDYKFNSGDKVEREGIYNVTITDSVGNTTCVKLIVDKTAPTPIVFTDSGEVSTGKTNEPFRVACAEDNCTIKIAQSATSSGSPYEGELISESGLHWFRITDFIGNEIVFSVEIDLNIDYFIQGNHKRSDDGSYISREGVSISIKEEYSEFIVQDVDGEVLDILPEEKITQENTYIIFIRDNAGNETNLTVIIDKTAPEFIITGVSGAIIEADKIVNEGFTVVCEEDNSFIEVSLNGIRYSEYNGAVCNDANTYYFAVSDFIGNTAQFTVTVDLGVIYIVSGEYVNSGNTYASKSNLTLEVKENLLSFDVVSSNGYTFKNGETVNREGEYYITITDVAGNTVRLEFVIDKTAPTVSITTQNTNRNIEPDTSVNEGFIVKCPEYDAELNFSSNGMKYGDYNGQVIDEAGTYFFKARDYVGNENVFTVTIDYEILYSIKGSTYSNNTVYASNSSLILEVKEDLLSFDVVSSNEFTVSEGIAIDKEGEYRVVLTDLAGNTVSLTLIIDKTAPTPHIVDDEGGELSQNTVTRRSFSVSCIEDDVRISYSADNSSINVPYQGDLLSSEQIYEFTITDFVGNVVRFTIELDCSVNYTVKGYFVTDNTGEIISKTWVAIEVKEKFALFTVNGKIDDAIIAGERISLEGKYEIIIDDIYGNRTTIVVVIDKTAPKIVANVENNGSTADDVTVSIEEAKVAYYRLNGVRTDFDTTCLISGAGKYTIYAEDLAGNSSSYSFTIDNAVSYQSSPSIVSGQILTSDISFKFDEKVATTLVKDGENIEYKSLIKDVGNYVLTATDELGNVLSINFIILPESARNYAFEVPSGYTVSAKRDGADFSVENYIEIYDDGVYSFVFSNEIDEKFEIEITVDTVAPKVEITQEKKQVIFSDADKENVIYELYKDGERVDAKPNKAITERGNYTLIVSDELGNVTTYNFKLDYLNTYSIVVICFALVVVSVVLIGALIYRKKQAIK